MNHLSLKEFTIAAIAILLVAWTADSVDACSRIVVRTPGHGVIVSRTLDWQDPLGEIAEVSMIGQRRSTRSQGSYKNPAKWTVKYQTLNFIEPLVFDDTVSEGQCRRCVRFSSLHGRFGNITAEP